MEYFVSLHSCSVFDSEYYLPAVIQPERFSQHYFPLDLIQRFSVPNIDFKMLFLSVLLKYCYLYSENLILHCLRLHCLFRAGVRFTKSLESQREDMTN